MEILYCIILQKGVGGSAKIKYNIILAAGRRPENFQDFESRLLKKMVSFTVFISITTQHKNKPGSFITARSTRPDRHVKRETAARRAAGIFLFSSVFSRFLQYNIIFQNGVGGSAEILYCIILQKGVGGWVEKSRFFNYVISECPLTSARFECFVCGLIQ